MKYDKVIEMFRNIATSESEYAPSFTINCLLQVDIEMKNGCKIIVVCGEKCFVDCASENYIGIDATVVRPIKDIKNIDLKFR